MTASVMAYVAYRPCGHPVALLVDDGEDPKGLSSDIAKLIRDGRTVERVTIERAREIGVVYCSCVPTIAEAKNLRNIARRGKRSRRYS